MQLDLRHGCVGETHYFTIGTRVALLSTNFCQAIFIGWQSPSVKILFAAPGARIFAVREYQVQRGPTVAERKEYDHKGHDHGD